jgi:hypothetical protein
MVEDRRGINVETEVVIPGLEYLDVVGRRWGREGSLLREEVAQLLVGEAGMRSGRLEVLIWRHVGNRLVHMLIPYETQLRLALGLFLHH